MPWVGVSMDAPEAAAEVRSAVESELGGRLDGVLVNAGGPKPGEALSLSDDDWGTAYELLLGGPLRLLRALDPLLNDGSAIAWVLSSSVRQPIPNLDASNVFRPGLAALVKVLARELGPRVRVNGLAPGRIDTARIRSMNESQAEASGRSVEDVRRAAEAGIPLERYGEPA